MKTHGGGSTPRCLAVWLAVSAAAAGLVWFLLPDLVGAQEATTSAVLTAQPFERLLEWLCAYLALAGTAWLWLATTLVALQARRGVTRRVHGVPAPLRRLLLLACGAALSGGLAAPALATPGALHQDHTGTAAAALVRGLPLPDRATGAFPGGARMTGPGRHAPAVVLVRPGDTLWDLAGQSHAWHRIYELNRDRIGPDPDLIRPGQRLRLPRH
jgi:hypothetical protein